MQRIAILIFVGVVATNGWLNAQDAAAPKVNTSITSKENELLKRENELLKKEVEQLKAEVAELKKELRRRPKAEKEEEAPDDDQFAVGTAWAGTRFYKNGAKEGQPWRLEITKRKGATFEGKISFEAIDNNQVSFTVNVKAPVRTAGPVEFESEKKGLFKQYYSGQIDKGGEVATSFRGTSVPGVQVEGRAILRKK